MYEYREEKQLEKLLKAFKKQMEEDLNNLSENYMTIRVGGKTIKIQTGAPQFEGVCKMVEHIASENFYTVDFENSTVKGCFPTVEEICIRALKYSLEQVETSEIDVLDMVPEANKYWLKEAIEVLQKAETEE